MNRRMLPPFLTHFPAFISVRLSDLSIARRIRYLLILNSVGLFILLSLGLLHNIIKNHFFGSIERLSATQRELLHFDTETARLQAGIRQYLNMPDDVLLKEIDASTTSLFKEFSQLEHEHAQDAENLTVIGNSLRQFVEGFRELKQLNLTIEHIYQTELLEPSERAADLLALISGSTEHPTKEVLLRSAMQTTVDAFIDAMLKMNAYYARRETTVSLTTRASLEKVAAMTPVLEELAPGDFEREAVGKLRGEINNVISGLGSLQRSFANRQQILARKIDASQIQINSATRQFTTRNTELEDELRNSYTRQLAIISALSIVVALMVFLLTSYLGVLISRSIRKPLSELLQTVEAYSAGDFAAPIPEVGNNELAPLAGALEDLRHSAMQREHAEQALRNSEARFRSLSDMSSDFFWEQDAELRYCSFSGQRAAQLQEAGVLRLGDHPWDGPGIAGYEEGWAELRSQINARRPFRDFEFALRMPDGSLSYLQANGDPIFAHDGTFLGYRGTAKDISAQKATEAEIRQLNQSLEKRVAERTAELSASNQQLSQAMEQLVQNEKLASLGNLVAGVAHELNTPLGNALVATTAMREQLGQLDDMVENGLLRKSNLVDFLGQFSEGCQIIERNTNRAASLVASFKQVAVDQTSANRRRFGLRQTIQEVLSAMAPSLRKMHLTVTVDIPDGVVLDSYPGALDQVVTNIITNAGVHAFDEGQHGELLISAEWINGEEIVLMLSDNGVGIPAERQGRVFDPFFTTRMGQGGTGLGLYIVYNIVTNLLGGHVQLVSATGAGTCFLIRLPRTAPEHDTGDFVQSMSPPERTALN